MTEPSGRGFHIQKYADPSGIGLMTLSSTWKDDGFLLNERGDDMTEKEKPGTGATVHGAKGDKRRGNLLKNYTDNSISCQSAAAQRQRILDHLKKYTLSTLDAREWLDIMHPAMRVLELRRRGYNIKTEWTTEYSLGSTRPHRIALYILQPDEARP